MRIFVKARPLAGEEKVEKIDDLHYYIWVKEPPSHGLANKAIVKAAAEYFKVPISTVKMISGFTCRQKVLLIG